MKQTVTNRKNTMLYISYALLIIGGILYLYVMGKVFCNILFRFKNEKNYENGFLLNKDKVLAKNAATLFALGAIAFVIAAFSKACANIP